MSYESIARRYARAIFEIGQEAKNLPALTKELTSLADTYEGSEELRLVLGNPLVPEESQEAVVNEIATRLGCSETAKATARLLTRRRRLAALPEIARHLSRLADADQNIVRAEVTSAGSLGSAYLSKLQAELEKGTGKKVIVTHKEDKSLLLGIVVKIGDRVIDGSVRARLKSFREGLLRN